MGEATAVANHFRAAALMLLDLGSAGRALQPESFSIAQLTGYTEGRGERDDNFDPVRICDW